jgi:hypothetical protein
MNKGSNTLHIKDSLITIACKFIIYEKRNFLRIMLLPIAIFLAFFQAFINISYKEKDSIVIGLFGKLGGQKSPQ